MEQHKNPLDKEKCERYNKAKIVEFGENKRKTS